MKVAKLVRVSLVTRVIVDDDATQQEIMELAIPKLSENLMNSPLEHIDEIVDDTECPFTPEEAFTPTYKERIVLNRASRYLIYDDEVELLKMVKSIINQKSIDETRMIDYIDGVQVWEKIEFRFSCKDFLEEIKYSGEEFKD